MSIFTDTTGYKEIADILDDMTEKVGGVALRMADERDHAVDLCEHWKFAYQNLFNMVEAGATITAGKVNKQSMDVVLYCDLMAFRDGRDDYKYSHEFYTGEIEDEEENKDERG